MKPGKNHLTRCYASVDRRWLRSLTFGILSAIITSIPVRAAERIYFNYGPLNLSIGVNSLAAFAKNGTVDDELKFYLGRVSQEDREEFRKTLEKSYQVNPVQLSRIFYTSIGEQILSQIGNLIQIQGGINGKYALRAALVQAAASPQGLSVISFLEKLPTNIQLNTEAILETRKRIELLVEATQVAVNELNKLSNAEIAAEGNVNFPTLPDMRNAGELGFEKQNLLLKDARRNRQFPVILYRPKIWKSGKNPVVIISHGLASRPEDFSYLAEHLASYGYVVALPNHIGSNFTQVQSLLAGYTRDIFQSHEFIDRPLDISYVIDELERRNQSEFHGRLNLQSVGVYGHSLGGYTALALGGAEINFDQLQKDCDRTVWEPNLSLLLQCLALQLPRKTYNFRDPRVKAVFVDNPVNSSIYGAKGLSSIQIPIFLGAGSLDIATPAVLEQIRSFLWLNTPDKYLALAEGQAHVDFSQIDPGITALIQSASNLTLPEPTLLHNYVKATTLAFFQLYLTDNASYRPYLEPAYAQYISEKPFPLFLITSRSVEKLKQAFLDFKTHHDFQ